MGFFAVIFALALGTVAGFIFGIGCIYKMYYDTTDEEFEKKINELRDGRNNYKSRHKE